MKIIVALDKFKGTLSAGEACRVVASAIKARLPEAEVEELPMADGGEGYASVMGRYLGLERQTLSACNALGEPVGEVGYYVGGETVVADSASVLSLSLIAPDRRRVVDASSEPLGRFLRAIALRHGPGRHLKLGVGGTSTADGGDGVLRGLGYEHPVAGDAVCLFGSVELMCDVDVPLLAPDSRPSAMTFVAQKGCLPGDREIVRRRLERWQMLLDPDCTYRPGDGAGGGIPFGLTRVLPHCTTASGAESVIKASGLFSGRRPDLVIVGEGCLDSQSMLGKIAGRIASEARRRGISVGAVAGSVDSRFAGSSLLDFVIDSSRYALSGAPLDAAQAAYNLRRAIERYDFRTLTPFNC